VPQQYLSLPEEVTKQNPKIRSYMEFISMSKDDFVNDHQDFKSEDGNHVGGQIHHLRCNNPVGA
jgi:hypothetical protein